MFTITHMDKSDEEDPKLGDLSRLYDELENSGIIDGDVCVIDQNTGWCMSAHRDGRLVLEHLGEGGERHMIPVNKQVVIELWEMLINGRLHDVLKHPWKSGYL